MRKRKAIKSIISALFLQFVTIICGFIIPKLIIENYGSATNGLINSITQFLAYITLLQSGFGPVVKSVLYKPLAKKDNKELADILKATQKFFKNIGLIFIFYLIILCFVYPLFVNNNFNYFYTISLILILSISIFGEYFIGLTYQLFLQADQKSYVYNYVQVFTTIVNTILIIVLIKLNCSIQIVKLLSACIFIIRPIILLLYFKKNYNIDVKSADSNYQIKQKWDGLAQHIAAVIHSNTDIAVITIFCNILEVSVYSVYMLAVKGIQQLVQSLTNGIDATFGDMFAKKEYLKLNTNFKKYEFIYHTISTVLFICMLLLITPFVKVYTSGITDVNYDRPLFGYLIVISEFIWAIRLPYNSLTLAVGHFKQTQKGAWLEALVNISISLILVFKFGIVGVAIGTIVAMFIRTIEFMYHTSKYILKRSIISSFKWILVITIETLLSCIVVNSILEIDALNYIELLLYSFMVFIIVLLIVLIINLIVNFKLIGNTFNDKNSNN